MVNSTVLSLANLSKALFAFPRELHIDSLRYRTAANGTKRISIVIKPLTVVVLKCLMLVLSVSLLAVISDAASFKRGVC